MRPVTEHGRGCLKAEEQTGGGGTWASLGKLVLNGSVARDVTREVFLNWRAGEVEAQHTRFATASSSKMFRDDVP